MSDRDAISDLRGRVSQLETDLAYVRKGKTPPQSPDLLAWRANTNAAAHRQDGWMAGLREEWHGLTDAVSNWAVRFEKRLRG